MNLRRIVAQGTRSAQPHADEAALLLDFVAERLPCALGPVLAPRTCPHDVPPDRASSTRCPGTQTSSSDLAPRTLARSADPSEDPLELAFEGRSSFPIEPFRADRPALVDAAFTPVFSMKGKGSYRD